MRSSFSVISMVYTPEGLITDSPILKEVLVVGIILVVLVVTVQGMNGLLVVVGQVLITLEIDIINDIHPH